MELQVIFNLEGKGIVSSVTEALALAAFFFCWVNKKLAGLNPDPEMVLSSGTPLTSMGRDAAAGSLSTQSSLQDQDLNHSTRNLSKRLMLQSKFRATVHGFKK